mmetsp:Transcript_13788/g.58959  ORF Transcript_13788/g.58959 Transcript_13788/m.58959 type:complete len:694 (+) Transcript_13788:1711-3792(+)
MRVFFRLEIVQLAVVVRLAHVQGEVVVEILVLFSAQLVEANLDVGVAHVVLVRVGPGVVLEERVHADDAQRRHGAREGHGVQRGLGVHARDQVAEIGAVGVVQVVLHGPAQVVHERGHHRDDAPHDPRQHHAEGQHDDEQDEQAPPPDERGGENHEREREHRARRGENQRAGGVELRLDLVLRLFDGFLDSVQRFVHLSHGVADFAESHGIVRRGGVDGGGDGASVVNEVQHGVHHGLRQVGNAVQQRGALGEDHEAPGGGERDEDENNDLVDHQILLGELAGLVRAVAALAAQRAADGARDVHEDHEDHHRHEDDRHGEAGHGLAHERQEVVGVGELKAALVRAGGALAGQTSHRRGERRGRRGGDRGGRGAGGGGGVLLADRHFRGHRDVTVNASEVLLRPRSGPREQHVANGVNPRGGELANPRGGLDLDGDDGVLVRGLEEATTIVGRHHAAASEVLDLNLDVRRREGGVQCLIKRARRGGELGGDVVLEKLPLGVVVEVVRVEVVQVDVGDDLAHFRRGSESRRRGRNSRGHVQHLVHHLFLVETDARRRSVGGDSHETVEREGVGASPHAGNCRSGLTHTIDLVGTGVLVTGNSGDHGGVATSVSLVGTDVRQIVANAPLDELHDQVEEFGILFVDVVVAQAAHGQEVFQSKPRVRRFIIALGLRVECSGAAEDALAAGQIMIGIWS